MTPDGVQSLKPSPGASVAGQTFGSYRILGRIGAAGAMYVAIDTRLGRQVALQFLTPDAAGTRDFQQFKEEVCRASALNHPNIPVVHEIGEAEGRQFIVTEFVEGRTLPDALRDGLLPPAAIDIAIQVSGALSAALQAGIQHGNLTPGNIVIRPDGYIKILGFGLANGRPASPFDARPDILGFSAILHHLASVVPELAPISEKASQSRSGNDYHSVDEIGGELAALGRSLDTDSAPEVLVSDRRSVLPNPRRRKFLWGAAAGVACLSAAALRLFRRDLPVSTDRLHIVTLPADSQITEVAASPDGKYAACVVRSGEHYLVRIKNLTESGNERLILENATNVGRAIYSPDGNYVYYNALGKRPSSALYRLSAAGGAPQLLIEGTNDRVSFAPDGKQFAYTRSESSKHSLMIANSDGTGERRIATFLPGVRVMSHHWTPDGKAIQHVLRHPGVSSTPVSLMEVPANGGPGRAVLPAERISMRKTAMTERSGFFALSTAPDTRLEQIYYITLPQGRRIRLTNDGFYYYDFSLSANGGTILGLQRADEANIFVFSLASSAGSPRQITTGIANLSSPNWGPGNTIVYSAWNGPRDLWQISSEGGPARQLTTTGDLQALTPAVTRDGRFLAYSAGATGAATVVVREFATGSTRVLIQGALYGSTAFSPDGKQVYYTRSDDRTLWRIPFEGGAPALLTEKAMSVPSFSPSGKLMAYVQADSQIIGSRIIIRAVEGGDIVRQIILPPAAGDPSWLSEDTLFYSLSYGPGAGFWRYPLHGAPPVQLLKVNEEFIRGYSLSADGKRLVYCAGRLVCSLVKITGFR